MLYLQQVYSGRSRFSCKATKPYATENALRACLPARENGTVRYEFGNFKALFAQFGGMDITPGVLAARISAPSGVPPRLPDQHRVGRRRRAAATGSIGREHS